MEIEHVVKTHTVV